MYMQSNDYNNDNENDYDETFDNEEFVFTKKDGQYVGGGYKVQSMFLEKGISPVTTFNKDNDQNGGKISTPFEYLAVPAGLFYINQRTLKNKTETPAFFEHRETISDDIFDKLFGLVDADENKRKKHRTTKRSKHNPNKLTKRRK